MLDQCESRWDDRASVGIVLAAGGYPGSYNKGDVIEGLPEGEVEGEKVFHAGTRLQGEQVLTNGGRVLCATALGDTVTEAQQRAYQVAGQVTWNGAFYRKDIAWRAIARENS
jgi:phosphoribosylamine--glycine ligase